MAKLKGLVMCAAFTVLAGCTSTAPKKVAVQTNKQSSAPLEQEQLVETPDYYLDMAEAVYQQTADPRQRNLWILRSAESYSKLQQCQQVNKIVSLSLPQISDPILLNQAHLLLAECIVQNQPVDYPKLYALLTKLDPNLGLENRIYSLQLQSHIHQGQYLEAAKLRLKTTLPTDANYDVWYLLQHLSTKELQDARLREPQLQPWLQLSLVVRQYGLDKSQLLTAITDWQNRFPSHPLSTQLPAELKAIQALPEQAHRKVAVLLPLTGRLAPQGLAIKQGVLAAYYGKLGKQGFIDEQTDSAQIVHFFDTNLLTVEAMAEQLQDYDAIVGPLMKNELEQFLPVAPLSADIVALNQLDTQPAETSLSPLKVEPRESMDASEDVSRLPTKKGIRVYFALSPEEEAWQLASRVQQQGVRYPIVVSQESGASRRMAEAFMEHWQLLQEQSEVTSNYVPRLATFTDNKSMRTSVTTLLDVAQSNTRINQIEYLTSEEIHSVPRNRRDVDGIIVFATAQQTELLNPIIESSLSPFNDKAVPVFASSRSYSKNLSNNSLRDLRNLTFSDMPWMLPQHPWQDLAKTVEVLWPQQDDTLRRLFALGFDAYNLTAVIDNLTTLPQLSVNGLTGKLSVDPQGNVQRVLSLGRVGESKVERVNSDE